ncbi:hypothetical protein [Litorihabitans aurantiacus]|uniref:Uncharacterized protein n=1 Tax=Litorihabitans aurantiacus TaxID=1930061 RepID=A0AA37XF37_9MICO|nr:hypothetical protein [Litorihabitans aurantiacus]GMA31595.1 hypothetical protein GCM10025875_15870 [Litorihabitans aurantiacus]
MTRPSSYVPATSVIDITAPGGIEALLAFQRARFGDATMMADGDGGDPAGGSDPAGTDPAGDDPADPAASSDPAGADPAEAENVEQLPAWAQKLIRDTRSEAAGHRTKANDQLQAIGKALGLVKDGDGAPTVESLTQQLTEATTVSATATEAARAAQVELAVYRAAATHHGDPGALLDSRSFLAKVSDLDPADQAFQTKVDAAIKAAVDANPKLKAVQVAARSGSDLAGGTGEGKSRTPKSLTDAVANAYGD